jgi:Ca-activated chloride channel family protein
MRTEVRLSTRFLTTQNAHQVGMLVSLIGEAPVRRPPINVALVLDRSGSMDGPPLAAAREAAGRFASFLSREDRLSIVTFDDVVETIYGPAPGGDPGALDAIAAVRARGSTNLSGGWLMGRKLVARGRVEGTNRVVLLTDGQANAGVVAPDELAGLARGAASRSVSTTCIGFGAHFNEDLLEGMAQAGGGNYWYAEADDQMTAIFEGEIEGLVALAAQNVEVGVRLTHANVAGVSFLQSYPVVQDADGWRVRLHDLYATSPKALGLVFHVEDVQNLGKVQLGEVVVEADVVSEEGIEHRITRMPVLANLDGEERIEPTVEQTFLQFRVAQAREDAVRHADRGDFDGAAVSLCRVAETLKASAPDPATMEEIDDLRAEAARLRQRLYAPADRKYQGARAMANRDLKVAYSKQVSRRRPEST